MEEYDVLIVGAGPTGSAAAKKCMDGGLKTLLIDKRKLPRRKNCSGIITNTAQNYVFENFGPIPEDAYGKPYISKGMAMHFPSHGTVFRDYDCYALYVWRDKFDYFLASSSGAKLQDQTRFVNLEEKGDKIEATLKSKTKSKTTKRTVRAKYIIAADGARSNVILKHAPEVYDGMPWVYACQKYFEGKIDADEHYLYWLMKKGFGPMPWLNMKDDQMIIGLAYTPTPGVKFSVMYAKYLEYLKQDFGLKIKKEIAVEGCYANTMTSLNRFFPGRRRVLACGDAMGLQHQGGEGISCGMESAGYAGEAIIESLKTGAEALPLYKKLVEPEVITALDQFNPFRAIKTAGNGMYRQPPFFENYGKIKRAKMLAEMISFAKAEFGIFKGMLPEILKSTATRTFLGKYKINMLD